MALTNDDLQAIAGLLQPINVRLDGMEHRLDKMENRLDKIESEMSALKANQLELKKDVKEINLKVTRTYELALDAWGIGTENREWLKRDKLEV